ncbi:MAG: Cas10/Cmr2 second palm domain-containing protein [Streptosporangiaceae bacterium]
MSGKDSKGKGKPKKGSRQQQQQDAARRHGVPPAGARDQQAVPGQAGRAVRGPALPGGPPRQDAEPAPQAARPARVSCYADVAAVRIQDWLARTPGLIFRRGASALLSKATDPEEWKGHLPPGVRWNDEAGHVDGVVSLVADDSAAGADAPTVLQDAARHVAQRMRDLIPHCPVQGVAGTGTSYAEAYAGMANARREGDFLLDWPSAPPETLLAKPCDQCRQAAATVPGVKVTRDDALCAECDARLKAAGRTTANETMAPAPERRLRRALEAADMPVTGFSDNFAEMAAAGRRDRDDTPSQVALIYADGNRVGAFLSRAAAAARGPKKSEIAPILEKAALDALANAVMNRFPGWEEPPVLPHLAGGDDLLVSVPAIDAWLFVVTLVSEFGRQVAQATSGWPEAIREHPPSLSAGLVFHHKTAPFFDVMRLADEQLLAAKNATAGRAATVAFLDLTADGSQPPPGREPMTLRYLQDNADRFGRTADLPDSRRATLLDLARREAWEEFTARLTDLPNDPLWEFAAGRGATAGDVRKALHVNGQKLAEVRRALDVARHWHAEPRQPGPSGGER